MMVNLDSTVLCQPQPPPEMTTFHDHSSSNNNAGHGNSSISTTGSLSNDSTGNNHRIFVNTSAEDLLTEMVTAATTTATNNTVLSTMSHSAEDNELTIRRGNRDKPMRIPTTQDLFGVFSTPMPLMTMGEAVATTTPTRLTNDAVVNQREASDTVISPTVADASGDRSILEDDCDDDDDMDDLEMDDPDDERLARRQFVSRQQMEKLLREDDAALLESVRDVSSVLHDIIPPVTTPAVITGNQSCTNDSNRILSDQQHLGVANVASVASTTPQTVSLPLSSSTNLHSTGLVPHEIKSATNGENALPTSYTTPTASLSPAIRKKKQTRQRSLVLNEVPGLLIESNVDGTPARGPNRESIRRALSGEIWITTSEHPDMDDDVGDDLFDNESVTALNEGVEDSAVLSLLLLNSNETGATITSNQERRRNEAAQFAEAVGDIPLDQQEELRIIEEEPECDDEDDDATEIRLERIPSKIDIPRKARPQWPFNGSRFLLDNLPSSCPIQDYVYKGIQCNPPEIIKRGISRGNYAQLHRKAWLEVSDKYHRYGKNLRLYYRHWETLGCPTNMFFDWLDSKGEAAGQPLPELEDCPRSVLDSDTVLYINNPDVTTGYAVRFAADELGRARVYDVDGDPVRTGSDGWIFVLRDNVIYGAQKITSVSGQSKQRFHHSSFFGGKAVAAAGIFLTDDDGILTRLYPHSGHYRPGEADMQRVLFYLHHEGVDLRTFAVDMQQLMRVARDQPVVDGPEKKKKTENLQLVPAVTAACFLAHKARFIGEKIIAQIHQIRRADVTSVSEALALIKSQCDESAMYN